MINEKCVRVCVCFSLVDCCWPTAWLESSKDRGGGRSQTFHFYPGLRLVVVVVVAVVRGKTVMPFLLKYIEGKQGGELLVRRRKSAWQIPLSEGNLQPSRWFTLSLCPLFFSPLIRFLTRSFLPPPFSPSVYSLFHIQILTLPCPRYSSYLPLPVFVKAQCFISPDSRPLQSRDPGLSLQAHCPNPPALHFLTH